MLEKWKMESRSGSRSVLKSIAVPYPKSYHFPKFYDHSSTTFWVSYLMSKTLTDNRFVYCRSSDNYLSTSRLLICLFLKQAVWPLGAANTVCLRPRARTNFIGLYSWPWQFIAHARSAYQFWSSYAFSFGWYDTLLAFSLSSNRAWSTFDLLTLKLVRITVRGIRNLLTNFDVSGTFRSKLLSRTFVRRTTWHRDLNLWHCWWCSITAIGS